jgi:hypothetical protein
MKKIFFVMTALSLLILSAQPTWARCAPLIKEGRELMSTTKASKADQDKAKGLLDEAQKNLDAGDHGSGVKNANAALDILKKK